MQSLPPPKKNPQPNKQKNPQQPKKIHLQNPTLLHSAKLIETIVSQNGTSASGAHFVQAGYFRGSSSLFGYCWFTVGNLIFFHEIFIHLVVIPIGNYRQNGNYCYCCCFASAALGVPEGNTEARGIEPRQTRGADVSALPALPGPVPCSAPVTRVGALPSPALGL